MRSFSPVITSLIAAWLDQVNRQCFPRMRGPGVLHYNAWSSTAPRVVSPKYLLCGLWWDSWGKFLHIYLNFLLSSLIFRIFSVKSVMLFMPHFILFINFYRNTGDIQVNSCFGVSDT